MCSNVTHTYFASHKTAPVCNPNFCLDTPAQHTCGAAHIGRPAAPTSAHDTTHYHHHRKPAPHLPSTAVVSPTLATSSADPCTTATVAVVPNSRMRLPSHSLLYTASPF